MASKKKSADGKYLRAFAAAWPERQLNCASVACTIELAAESRTYREASPLRYDFMFQLGKQEFAALISQIATSNSGRDRRRRFPYAFTEHGAIMTASLL